MARVISEFGYNVDVADYSNKDELRRIKQKYDLIVDIIPREKGFWSANMNEGCRTAIYMTGSCPQFAYEQESKRLADLERRKGARLERRRTKLTVPEIEAQIEKADTVWFIGNKYNLRSYDCFIKNTGYNFGWVDINGPAFREVTEKCAFVIMPSCSEGLAGSVLTAMSAGLIPIVSRECGYDDDEAENLPDCETDTIRRYVLDYSRKPDDWIRERSARSIETATTTFSFESFTRSVREAVATTTGESPASEPVLYV